MDERTIKHIGVFAQAKGGHVRSIVTMISNTELIMLALVAIASREAKKDHEVA